MPDFTVPDSAAFRQALERLVGRLPESYVKMLQSHYAATDHTITATELAHAVGYKNYSAANLHYGKLAALLKSELEWSTGEFLVLKLLVEFVMPAKRGTPELRWTMRQEVAEALEALGWVSRGGGGA